MIEQENFNIIHKPVEMERCPYCGEYITLIINLSLSSSNTNSTSKKTCKTCELTGIFITNTLIKKIKQVRSDNLDKT